MCEIVTAIVSAVISIASTAYSSEQSRKNTRATFRHAENQAEYDAKLAAKEREAGVASMAAQELQNRESDSQALASISRQAREAIGAGVASAAESGTTGLSVSNLLGDFVTQESRAVAAVRRNQSFRRTTNQFQADALTTGYASRIASMQPGPIPEIDRVGAYARAAFQGYAQGLQIHAAYNA